MPLAERRTGAMKASAALPHGANATPPRRGVGLAARVLGLIVTFVMIAEIAIFIPSIAGFRRSWLANRLAAAYTAALVIEAAPDGLSSETLKQNLLDSVGVRMIVLKTTRASHMLAVADTPPDIDEMDDLRDNAPFAGIASAFRTLLAEPGRVLDIRAAAPMGADYIEVAMDEEPLQKALRAYSLNILLLSLAISLFVASLAAIAMSVMVLSPVRRLTGNVIRFAADPEDVSRIITPSGRTDEIGQAEEALADMERALARELREKKRLADLGLAVAKINHDLRNMLTSAQLLSDRLAESSDPVVARNAPKLVATLDRAIRFCRSTLVYGRSVDETPRLARIDLRPVAADALEAAIAGARTMIEPRLEIDGPLIADADAEQMYRVLNNLVRNAVEALDAAGGGLSHPAAILLRGTTDGDDICLRICDTGPGLPETARQNLFIAFQGGARAGGTGLGLAIAADLVRAHKGTIRVMDEELADEWPGARFEIRIPAKSYNSA